MVYRVCLGERQGSYGLFVSRPGYDVMTTSDAYLSFDSRVNSMFIASRGTVSILSGTNSVTVNFTPMGFVPIIDLASTRYNTDYGQILTASDIDGFNLAVTQSSFTISRPGGKYGNTASASFSYIIFGVPF